MNPFYKSEEILKALREHWSTFMHLDAFNIDTVYAFVLGMDFMTEGFLLQGFREWMMVKKLRSVSSLGHLQMVKEHLNHQEKVTLLSTEELAVFMAEEFFCLLEEFLSYKNQPDGLLLIYDSYVKLLKKKGLPMPCERKR